MPLSREICSASAADWLKRRVHNLSPVQRHRHERIGIAQELLACTCHPAPDHRREIHPVAVFERVDQRARDIVVAHRGAGALIGRRFGDRLHRQDAGAGVIRKGNAETRAVRRCDEGELAPAGGAEAAVGHQIAAGRAERRQRHVEASAGTSRAGCRQCVRGAIAPLSRRCPCDYASARQGRAQYGCKPHRLRSRSAATSACGGRSRLGPKRSWWIASPPISPNGSARCCGSSPWPSTSARRRMRCAPRSPENASIGTLIAASALARTAPAIVADEEALPFRDASLDLVVSALALQFVNDLPGALVQIRRALKPDGLFLAALLGGDTLIELRQAFGAAEAEIEGGISPHVAPFADVREMGALLQRAGLRTAGDRRGAVDGAIFVALHPDGRAASHGRDQRACRASPHAAAPRHADAHGRDLRAALRRSAMEKSARRSR